jgi:SdrD B-like domain
MTAPINAPLATAGPDTIIATIDDTDVAWNTFGWTATRLDNSTLVNSAPTKVGIEVQSAPGLKLGNYTWYDANQNGQQDEGIANGINGIKVELYNDLDGNIGTTGDQTLIGTQFTTNDPTSTDPGYYLFQGLSTGNYFVRFHSGTTYPNISPANTGADATDSDGVVVSGQPYVQTAMYNLLADNLTIDQGFYDTLAPLPAAIGNFVWIDANSNGVQDAGEVGLNGVTVMLLSSTGLTVGTTTTSSTVNGTGGNASGLPGYYYFSGLSAGTYSVKFTLPSGYTFTAKDVTSSGGTDTTDSDADVTTGVTGTYTLIAGDNNLTVDAGLKVTPVVTPPSGGGGGGGGSYTPPAPIVISTSTGVTPPSSGTPIVKRPIVKKPPVVAEKIPALGFVLPEILLDTGTPASQK